ncbi:SpoIIE family protein phosphatase [Turneriella parva]|uniref:Stage II sporulation protein E n=1 Tax=Turneriella parva (strain ATCC BAA-1111 / DSM 21527 / NCTC 11395 / H) TaxID=869212 RepID=I4B5C7_TURPD|nr:SpoIIE family protein phosphatase [Turneriella parva]AFM12484.1 Stage II sporulation protein E [Turneriella parva DSM 21527]
MNFLQSVYLDYFTLGSVIPVLFLFICAAVFFQVKDKSRATKVLANGLLIYGIFVSSYIIASTFYHPLAAFHRWSTVGFVLIAVSLLTQIFFEFPEPVHTRVAKILVRAMIAVAIGFATWFMVQTHDSGYIYHFEGHYYDFDADDASYVISIAILVYVFTLIGIGIWRVIAVKGRDRWTIAGLILGIVAATILPAYLNTLSREGGMDRGTFQTVFDMSTILGAFVIVIIYMNNTSDKTTFMAKIILVSVVVFLLVLQGISYFAFQEKESAYDGVKSEQANRFREVGIEPEALRYAISYDLVKKKTEPLKSIASAEVDVAEQINGYEFAFVWQKIYYLNEDIAFKDKVEKILQSAPPTFAGYANAIFPMLEKKETCTKAAILGKIDKLQRPVIYRRYKLSKIPDFNFREAAIKFLGKSHRGFETFSEAMRAYLKENTTDSGAVLKAKLLQFAEEVVPPGARHYRKDKSNGAHYTAYVGIDFKKGKMVEVGFDYLDYRKYVHPLGVKFILLLIGAMVLIIVGFPFFFSRALVTPLNSLLAGVNQVNNGDLNVELPIYVEDEIGYLSRSFNGMVHSIKDSKQKLQEYAETLEDKVKERTAELQKAFEEVNALKKQQDGDYFLTSLLTHPLGSNKADSPNLNVDVLLEQKKKFEFRKWARDIGGDTCITSSITLKGKPHTVFLNADAMGKSMQGAGGILVLGSVFHSVIERTKLSPKEADVFPEHWLKYTFIELHRVFEVFDGSMLISLVMGLVDDESGLMYYINAEHPWSVLYRQGKAEFIEKELVLRKLGTQGVAGQIEVCTLQLEPKDVIFIGSDGRDDLLLGYDNDGARIINEDENLFLKVIEEAEGHLDRIKDILENYGELTDDLSLLRIGYKEDVHHDHTQLTQHVIQLLNRARLAVKANQLKVAIGDLEEAHRIDDAQPEVMRDLIKAYLKDKQFEKAANLAEDYIHIKPADSEFLYIASYCHKVLQNYKKAADFGERLRLRDHDMVKNLVNLADIYYLQGLFGRSRTIIDFAAKIDPHNPKVKRVLDALARKNTATA